MDDLAILFPERTLVLGEEIVTVKPFKFGQFKAVLEIVNRYLEVFAQDPETWVLALLELGNEAVDDLATLALFCVDRDRTWLDQLEGDLALDLFFKMFEVNMDFFVRKLQQGATALAGAITTASKAGQSSLPVSSPQDTVGRKSRTTAKVS